ncbi:phosphatase PAP2 family protein [Vibrio sp. TBV020]|uniref:phosphatase PAP2 family protein n=1 Tax=Vibrio sp. TBV020 TaxID=3137398 RepID=UPI0038CD1ECF
MRLVQPLIRFDLAFSTFCLSNRFNIPLSVISRWVSRSGDGPLYILIALMAYQFDNALGSVFVKTSILAFAIELPIYWMIKNTTRRRRPFECSDSLSSFIQPADRFSLPSGHTAGAVLMATMLSAFFPVLLPIAVVWAFAVGAARVMLGVHFFSDILVGAVLGFTAAQLALLLTM